MKKLAFLLCLLALYSCQSPELRVDVDKVLVPEIQIQRLDQDLFKLRPENFESESVNLKYKYGRAYEKYLINPLRINGSADSLYKQAVLAFINDKDIREANAEIQKLYSEEKMKVIGEQMLNCIKHFKYYFPDRAVPQRIITCQTGWNYAFAYVDSSFILGLDMYMGSDSKFYKMLAYPQYQTRKMNADYLLPDMARAWILSEFDNADPVNNLLNHCVFYGKLFYSVKALLPECEDSLIIGYTSAQMKYCKDYEKKLWAYMAEKNRLYENNMELVRELTSEGPFTGSISKECPPRIAMWMGWQIVRAYMKNNKEIELKDLMKEKDAQKILNKSRYRP